MKRSEPATPLGSESEPLSPGERVAPGPFSAFAIFVRERFHLGVSLPMAFALAGAAVARPDWRILLRLVACVWCLLLCARAADDIADLPSDRQRKPQRALASGRISVNSLGTVAGAAFLVGLLLLAIVGALDVVAVSAAFVSAALYYTFRTSLPALLKPFWLNLPFFVLVLLWSIERGRISRQDLLLATFVWSSVVAHDFSHSIEEQGSGSGLLSPATQARYGAACFCFAAASGLAFSIFSHDWAFIVPLVGASVWLSVLLVELLNSPSEHNSKKFYVSGCLFFLAPLLCRMGRGCLWQLF